VISTKIIRTATNKNTQSKTQNLPNTEFIFELFAQHVSYKHRVSAS